MIARRVEDDARGEGRAQAALGGRVSRCSAQPGACPRRRCLIERLRYCSALTVGPGACDGDIRRTDREDRRPYPRDDLARVGTQTREQEQREPLTDREQAMAALRRALDGRNMAAMVASAKALLEFDQSPRDGPVPVEDAREALIQRLDDIEARRRAYGGVRDVQRPRLRAARGRPGAGSRRWAGGGGGGCVSRPANSTGVKPTLKRGGPPWCPPPGGAWLPGGRSKQASREAPRLLGCIAWRRLSGRRRARSPAVCSLRRGGRVH